MFILPSCRPSAAISRRVLSRSSRSDAEEEEAEDAPLPPPLGLDGTEQSGLSDGVAAPAGVPLRDCSWLAIGVISVPTSRIDTDTATAGAAAAIVDGENRSFFCGGLLAGPVTDDDGDEDLDDSSVSALAAAPLALDAIAAAAGFLEKMGLECTTWRPAIHFSASFHLDGTCCRKNGADTAAVAVAVAVPGRAALSSLQNSKLPPPAEAPFSTPLSLPLPLPPQLRLRAALPWLASERDREESDRWSLGYSAGRRRWKRSTWLVAKDGIFTRGVRVSEGAATTHLRRALAARGCCWGGHRRRHRAWTAAATPAATCE